MTVAAGDCVAMVGASGSGKSTVLRVMARLLAPDQGLISGAGSVGLMFQQPRLLPWRTVLENVHLQAELQGLDRRRRARELLELLGIAHLADRKATQISGGEQQRTALARSLLMEPQLLLLDEPFASLDALTREDLHLELLRVLRLTGAACVMVTHDIHEAVFVAKRVLLLGRGVIQREFAVPAPVERSALWRYSSELAAVAAEIRLAMVGLAQWGGRSS